MKPECTFEDTLTDPFVGESVYLVNVRNHPRGLTGDIVLTSAVEAIRENGRVIETVNTIYRKR